MKRIFTFLGVVATTLVINAQDLAFSGGDFENFEAFVGGLNNYGLKSYAVLGQGQGVDGSNSLNITANPSANHYVFTALTPAGIPNDVEAITFMVKGTSNNKSLSLNVYKEGGSEYYKFNVGVLNSDVTITPSNGNSYSGSIDTAGQWVKVTLDLSQISDYNKDSATDFFALKVGKQSDFAIDLDNFKLVSTSLGVIDLDVVKSTSFVKNTIVNDELNFATKADVKVFDMMGREVKSASVSENKSLDLSGLSNGTYIVTGMINGEKVSEKIIKK